MANFIKIQKDRIFTIQFTNRKFPKMILKIHLNVNVIVIILFIIIMIILLKLIFNLVTNNEWKKKQ